MRKKLPPRVVGIYRDRSRFRVVICEDGKRRSLIVASQEEAQRKADEISSELRTPRPVITVSDAVSDWNQARLRSGTCKPLTVREQDARLRAFLSDALSLPIDRIEPEQASRIYLSAVERPCPKSGKPPAAASQRLYLKLSRALFSWAVQQGFCRRNPFADVKPVGDLRPCKPQLGVDEARRFLDAALAYFVQTHDALALAAATALLLGLRTREVLSRTVGDLKDAAQFLQIERGRSPKESQRWDVPTVLRSHLVTLAAGRAAEEPLFGRNRQGGALSRQSLHTLVRRLCQRADVPMVCIDSLRGLFAVLGPQSGTVPHAVAARLGLGAWPLPPAAWGDVSSPLQAPHTEESGPAARSLAASAAIDDPRDQPAALSQWSAEQIVAAVDATTLQRLRSLLGTAPAGPITPGSAGADEPDRTQRARASNR